MTLWRMRNPCWMINAIGTHSEYVIRIALPPHQWLHERALCYACIACLINVWGWRRAYLTKVFDSEPDEVSFSHYMLLWPSPMGGYLCFENTLPTSSGVRGGVVGWGTALQTGRSRVRFSLVSLEIFIDIILPVALWPWGHLSLWQKWVPWIFPGGKGGRCVGLTNLAPSCADYFVIWEPLPPETFRACPEL